MRKLLLGTAAALVVSAVPAAAEFIAFADVHLDRVKLVNEDIVVIKNVFLDVEVDVNAEKFSESMAISNQDNFDNHACENCAEKQDDILGSANANAGITSINQSSGSMNNQGTAIAFSVDVGGDVPDDPDALGFAEALAANEQVNAGNDIDTINILFRTARILGSGNNNSGVLYVNQSAGNINNQGNTLSVAVSLVPGVALSDAYLGQTNADNTVDEGGFINKGAIIAGSFNSNTGIVGVNQTTGNAANQSNVVAIAAAVGQ